MSGRCVVKYDCKRQAEINLHLNSNDEVVGLEIYYFEPVHLLDFNLDAIFQARPYQMTPSIVRKPPIPRQITKDEGGNKKQGCGGCR